MSDTEKAPEGGDDTVTAAGGDDSLGGQSDAGGEDAQVAGDEGADTVAASETDAESEGEALGDAGGDDVAHPESEPEEFSAPADVVSEVAAFNPQEQATIDHIDLRAAEVAGFLKAEAEAHGMPLYSVFGALRARLAASLGLID